MLLLELTYLLETYIVNATLLNPLCYLPRPKPSLQFSLLNYHQVTYLPTYLEPDIPCTVYAWQNIRPRRY